MLAACYTQKGSLEKYNLIPPEEYIAFLNDSWEILMKRLDFHLRKRISTHLNLFVKLQALLS